MDNMIFRSAVMEDYKDMKVLCDERFGEGYLTQERYNQYLENQELFCIARHGDIFAGFTLMMPSAAKEIASYMKMPVSVVERLAGDRKALICKSIAIQKHYAGQGLPMKMTEAVMKEAKKLGYGIIFSAAWMVDGKIPIGNAFKVMGFEPLYIRHNLWYDDEEYYCVVCGGRCRCDAAIYYKFIG